MTVAITVAGSSYSVPSSAADTDWAAAQVAFEQALAAALAKGPAIQRLSVNKTAVGTGADTTEDTLMTYTLPAGTLTAGQGVRVTGFGAGTNTADATTLRAYIGSQLVFQKILTASQANTWRGVFELLIIDASNATFGALLTQGGTATAIQVVAPVSFSLTAANANIIKFTGQRASTSSANSITQAGMIVELIP